MPKLLTLITLLPLLHSVAYSAPLEFPQASLSQTRPSRVQVKRGPARTLSARHQGWALLYQEGRQGIANWAQLGGPEQRLLQGEVELRLAGSILSGSDGRLGYGATATLKAGSIELNQTSHFGSLQRHLTRASLSVNDELSLQALHMVSGGKANTRVGPAVKFSKNLSAWYGVSTSGGTDLLMLNGNLRF